MSSRTPQSLPPLHVANPNSATPRAGAGPSTPMSAPRTPATPGTAVSVRSPGTPAKSPGAVPASDGSGRQVIERRPTAVLGALGVTTAAIALVFLGTVISLAALTWFRIELSSPESVWELGIGTGVVKNGEDDISSFSSMAEAGLERAEQLYGFCCGILVATVLLDVAGLVLLGLTLASKAGRIASLAFFRIGMPIVLLLGWAGSFTVIVSFAAAHPWAMRETNYFQGGSDSGDAAPDCGFGDGETSPCTSLSGNDTLLDWGPDAGWGIHILLIILRTFAIIGAAVAYKVKPEEEPVAEKTLHEELEEAKRRAEQRRLELANTQEDKDRLVRGQPLVLENLLENTQQPVMV